ncbi:hypothetical protein Rwratislav_43976 [Rhodococcus wratislaviensis IFP 2016]|nr:hypothetical protein Rwratislav_43976 [Rhodococcus wratislaviensis IFP 2016]
MRACGQIWWGEAGVVASGEDDDVGVAKESLLVGLRFELIDGDRAGLAESQVVRGDDLVEGGGAREGR